MALSYSRLNIIGPISVEPIIKVQSPETTFMILLMGPTGAGKSSFIECIGNRKNLGISRDQLEGYTDDVRAYRLVNVVYGHGSSPIIFIDTPGFLDRKIPESRVLSMIRRWMKQNEVDAVHRIIYFHRITDTRVAGSAGKILKLFRALTGEPTASNITLATTMWDTLWTGEQRERAESRLKELGDSHWKLTKAHFQTFVEKGTVITRYENGHESAMAILNIALGAGIWERFHIDDYLEGRLPMGSTKFGPMLHDNLVQRKAAIQQRLQVIKDDLNEEYAKNNPILEGILLKDEAEATSDLKVVEEELGDFGPVTALHNRLRVTGAISVEHIEKVQDVDVTFLILLIGPTGAGKSAFIERLVGNSDLGISGDTLEGVTQKITAYRLVNVVYGHGLSPIIVIDTPGLLECDIPETKILKEIQQWMKQSNVEVIHRMIYFHRITYNRMTDSALSAINIFRGITGESTGSNISIATTMWDRLSDTRLQHSEDKLLSEVRVIYFKDFTQEGSPTLKFDNDQNSALTILNETLMPGSAVSFHIEELSQQRSHIISGSQIRQRLYAGLISRLFSVEQRLYFAEQRRPYDIETGGSTVHETTLKSKADIMYLKREIQELKDATRLETAVETFTGRPPNASNGPAFVVRTGPSAPTEANVPDGRFSRQAMEDKPLPPIPKSNSSSNIQSNIPTPDSSRRLSGKVELSAQRIKSIFGRKR